MKAPATLAVVVFLLTAGLAPAAVAGPVPAADDASVSSTPSSAVASDDPIDPAADASAAVASNNTTTRLTLPAVSAENYSRVRLDFAATMTMDSAAVENGYHVSLVVYQIEQATSRTEANALVQQYLDAVEAELDSLQDAEVRAIQRHNAGAISTETLLVELALNDQRARAMEESLRRVQFSTDQLSQETNNRIRGLDVELNSLQTPILRHVATAARGDLDGRPNVLRVQTGQRGAVLEMLDGERYYRTAVRPDNRDLDAADQIAGISEFQNRVAEWYPWGYENRQTEDIDTLTDRNLYSMTFQHPQGQLVTYIDGGTTDVYREQQSLILDRLPTVDASTTQSNSLSVTLVRTTTDGPFHVNVTNATTGEPVDAVVAVDGTRIGQTGADGSLWVLSPTGEFDVSVVKDGTTVNVSVSS